MGARGPKSKNELSLIDNSTTQIQQRIAPPADLTKNEQSIFQDLVNQLPASWFNKTHISMMCQYCRHVSTSQMIAYQLQQLTAQQLLNEEGLTRFDKLSKMQERETRAITTLMRSMRLTHQATYDHKTSHTAKHAAGQAIDKKPWE
ncbi:hypothetical protein [Salinicola sp. CPA57]|uniref:hypothetical protein n=1 Tax=Salinicola sp. CPA57 TaxID=1949080 RepID=UPI0013007AED|nr:hypothetical protein [Salinicola sp. CPA57]